MFKQLLASIVLFLLDHLLFKWIHKMYSSQQVQLIYIYICMYVCHKIMKWRVNEQIELIHIEINGRIGETLFFFFSRISVVKFMMHDEKEILLLHKKTDAMDVAIILLASNSFHPLNENQCILRNAYTYSVYIYTYIYNETHTSWPTSSAASKADSRFPILHNKAAVATSF